MIDHRHFRAVRPAHRAAFELLPALCPSNARRIAIISHHAATALS